MGLDHEKVIDTERNGKANVEKNTEKSGRDMGYVKLLALHSKLKNFVRYAVYNGNGKLEDNFKGGQCKE